MGHTWAEPVRRVLHVHVGNEGDVVDRGVEHVAHRHLALGQVHLVRLALEDRARVRPHNLLHVATIVRHALVGKRVHARRIVRVGEIVPPLPLVDVEAVVHLVGAEREAFALGRNAGGARPPNVMHLAILVLDEVVNLSVSKQQKNQKEATTRDWGNLLRNSTKISKKTENATILGRSRPPRGQRRPSTPLAGSL